MADRFEMSGRQQSVDSADTDAASDATSTFADEHCGTTAEEDENSQKKKEESTIAMTTFNFINSIIGSGVVGVPFALKQAGPGVGILLIIVVAVFTDYSVILLIEGGRLANTNSYQGLVNAAFGRTGFLILTGMQFLYPFIAMISYNVVIGDTITRVILRIGGGVLEETALASRQFVIVIITAAITLPLSLYKNLAQISRASMVALVFIIFLMLVMVAKIFILKSSIPSTDNAWDFMHVNVTQAIGILSFSYMCHHNSFLLFGSLKNPTQSRWNFVTHLSIFCSMAIILIYGVAGYATFTGFTEGDVLENYCADDDLVNVARFVFAMSIVLTYPLDCLVTREVIENSIFASKERELGRHVLITVIVIIFSCGVSMATECLGVVLTLNGVLNAVPLAFVLPPLCVLRLQQDPILSLKSIPKIVTAAFGTCTFVVGLVMIGLDAASQVGCSTADAMPYCGPLEFASADYNRSASLPGNATGAVSVR